MELTMPRGGKRIGAGRKAHVPPLKGRCLRLTDAQMALLRMWGRGDASAGLRWLINQAKLIVRKVGAEGQTDSLTDSPS